MFLQYGPDRRWSDAFRDEQHCRLVWVCNRDDLLAGYPPGRRPQAWWHFDAGGLRYPGYDAEPASLWEAGLLSETERAALERSWQREFARAFAPNFFHCERGGNLKGVRARRAHFRWMGAPRALLARWVKERRRQRKTIRQLVETEAIEPPPAA
jgi:hypothetical protein